MRLFMIYLFYFTGESIKQCKVNANIPQSIPSETKNAIGSIYLEGVLYEQVVIIRQSIMNNKVMKEASVK